MTTHSSVSGSLAVHTARTYFNTRGDGDIVDLTGEVSRLLQESGLRAGIVTLFVPGATGAVTTLECEPGVVEDFGRLFDRIAPPAADYAHNRTHPDMNGHAHVRAGLLGPSLVVPFEEGTLCLGRWQNICFVCFDNRPRERTLVVQSIGVPYAQG